MNAAVIIFHKNVRSYPPEWIRQSVESIQKQTFKQFDVFEMDYGGSAVRIFPGSIFISFELSTHADAHNFLLDLVFSKGYDCAFNVNVDDYYAPDRFEKQLVYMQAGYDVVSSDFYNVNESGKVMDKMIMHDKSITEEAAKGHNIIAHPAVCYSKNFWTTCAKLIPEQIPFDDFELWKKSYEKYRFIIVPEFLLYYRVHSKKISKPEGGQEEELKGEEKTEIQKRPMAARPVGEWSEEEKEKHNKAREEWLRVNR